MLSVITREYIEENTHRVYNGKHIEFIKYCEQEFSYEGEDCETITENKVY